MHKINPVSYKPYFGNTSNDQKEIRPMEVKFIDFQSARFASLATDLVLFLFTSVRVSKIVATFYVYLLDTLWPKCLSIVQNLDIFFVHIPTKGQLNSKCPFGIIVWTKIPTKFFPGYLPEPL